MEFFLVTNNPQVAKMYPGADICTAEGSVLDLYTRVRDFVHLGHRLLTHPLCGSLKPGQIPYKTVILAKEKTGLDLHSLSHIESSIEACQKTTPGSPAGMPEQLLADYAAIDLSHVSAALDSLGI